MYYNKVYLYNRSITLIDKETTILIFYIVYAFKYYYINILYILCRKILCIRNI